MIVVKELRCRGCEGRLFVGSQEEGWRCVKDGFEGVFVDVLKPDPPARPRRRTSGQSHSRQPRQRAAVRR
jgi:hypothetical protein